VSCETAQHRYYRHLSAYERRSDGFSRAIVEQLRADGPPPPEPGDSVLGRLAYLRFLRNRRGRWDST
jgi:hypothetical protein